MKSLPHMVLLAAMLSTVIAGIAVQNASQRQPAWHTWLASLGLIAGIGAIVAVFVWAGRQLPN